MRATFYDLKLNSKTGRADIVKEKAVNCPAFKNLDTVDKASDFCVDVLHMEQMAEERSYILALNNIHKLLGIFEISHGDAVSCPVSVREVYKKALMIGAIGIIFVHNHPGGDVAPSPEDLELSKKLWEAGKLVEISFLDSIIIGGNTSGYSHSYSLFESGHFAVWDGIAQERF